MERLFRPGDKVRAPQFFKGVRELKTRPCDPLNLLSVRGFVFRNNGTFVHSDETAEPALILVEPAPLEVKVGKWKTVSGNTAFVTTSSPADDRDELNWLGMIRSPVGNLMRRGWFSNGINLYFSPDSLIEYLGPLEWNEKGELV